MEEGLIPTHFELEIEAGKPFHISQVRVHGVIPSVIVITIGSVVYCDSVHVLLK